MAANIIDDERLDDDNTEHDNINDLQKEAPQETTPPEDDIPDKYKGKSTAEIVRMHQEAEKLLGKQSGEVGELRSVVDSYIQTQLDTTTTPDARNCETKILISSLTPTRPSKELLLIILQLRRQRQLI